MLQLLLAREVLKKRGTIDEEKCVEHDKNDINIQKNHTYENMLFLWSILSQLSLVNKIYGNIVNFRKSMFLM